MGLRGLRVVKDDLCAVSRIVSLFVSGHLTSPSSVEGTFVGRASRAASIAAPWVTSVGRCINGNNQPGTPDSWKYDKHYLRARVKIIRGRLKVLNGLVEKQGGALRDDSFSPVP